MTLKIRRSRTRSDNETAQGLGATKISVVVTKGPFFSGPPPFLARCRSF
ncbi:hypothetical protein LptCag_1673 [Leptospirillum ferriphilum]|uniref:Uncharacterized protein n=1 Tax=Leptospirillum ferriphilum TaxID=178606 RepID=A0A094X2P2_9BACT|nr:hypothetical protein LptCag_1673 [Leptospirillum ferriphilum]